MRGSAPRSEVGPWLGAILASVAVHAGVVLGLLAYEPPPLPNREVEPPPLIGLVANLDDLSMLSLSTDTQVSVEETSGAAQDVSAPVVEPAQGEDSVTGEVATPAAEAQSMTEMAARAAATEPVQGDTGAEEVAGGVEPAVPDSDVAEATEGELQAAAPAGEEIAALPEDTAEAPPAETRPTSEVEAAEVTAAPEIDRAGMVPAETQSGAEEPGTNDMATAVAPESRSDVVGASSDVEDVLIEPQSADGSGAADPVTEGAATAVAPATAPEVVGASSAMTNAPGGGGSEEVEPESATVSTATGAIDVAEASSIGASATEAVSPGETEASEVQTTEATSISSVLEPLPGTQGDPTAAITGTPDEATRVASTGAASPASGAGAAPTASGPRGPTIPPMEAASLQDLARQVRETPARDCTVALPRLTRQVGPALWVIGRDERDMEDLAGAVLSKGPGGVPWTASLVDQRQCPALVLLANTEAYPLTGLGLSLDSPRVDSGGNLGGVVSGLAERPLTVLLIDDTGVVQSLDAFVRRAGSYARFDVPVQRDGPARETLQVVIALSGDGLPESLTTVDRKLATWVFRGLTGGSLRDTDVAVATVEIR